MSWFNDRLHHLRPASWRPFPRWIHRHNIGASFGYDDSFNIGFNVDFFSSKDSEWWKGDNVCTSTEESSKSISKVAIFQHFVSFSRHCTDADDVYKCVTTEMHDGRTKTTTDIFKCCRGYKRRETRSGCIMEINFDDLVDTASSLNLTQYVRIAKGVGVVDELRERNLTVFVPNDDAINQRMKSIERMVPSLNSTETPLMIGNTLVVHKQSAELVVNNTEAFLRCHMIEGIRTSGDWAQDQLLTTECPSSEGNTIRINFFHNPRKVITANCVKITSPDHLATNGVIHVTEQSIYSPTKSLMELVSKDPKFSILTSILRSTGMDQRLDGNATYTLFAPSNSAFMRLKPRFREALIGGGICLKGLLEGLLHSKVICSSIIEDSPVFTTNLQSETMKLERNKDGKLLIDGIRINKTDVMATNGVLHVVENLHIPFHVLEVTEKLKGLGVTKALKLFTEAGLSKLLTGSKDITVFLPSDNALEDLPDDVIRGWKSDPKELQSILKYHIVTNEKQRDKYTRRAKVVKTKNKKKSIMKKYRDSGSSAQSLTMQCRPTTIVERNLKACNINFSIIDKVLLPPKGTVIDILAKHDRVSMFLDIIRKAGLTSRLQNQGPFTIIAPTNKVLLKMEEKDVMHIIDADRLFKTWIMKGNLCYREIKERNMCKFRYALGDIIGPYDDFCADEEDMTMDQIATNGVVHIVNRRSRRHYPLSDILDYDI